MHEYKKRMINHLFIIIVSLVPQFIAAELSFTQIKHLHTVVIQKFDYLSALVGFSWWQTHTIENMYRYGNDQDATIQLLKELFHLQADDVTFDVTVLRNNPARYFNATIVGTIVGMLEMYKDETAENFPTQLDAFKTKLLKEIKKHFNAEQIVAEAKEKTAKEEKKKTELESEIKNAQNTLLELSNNSEYKSLDKQLQALNKQSRASGTELNKIRKRIKEKEQTLTKDKIAEMYKALEQNLDETSLGELGFSQDEANKIVKLQPEIEKYKKSIQELKAAKALLEDPTLLKTIATSKKELHAIESLLHKEQVNAKTLNAGLEKLVSLIAQAHAESLDNKYVPHIPQIILLAFLWKKANAKDEFKEYYNQVAQIAHIPLIADYPSDWSSEYTFQEYLNLKMMVEDIVSNNQTGSLLSGQGYEQLTFALAGYQFWDRPFPAFMTSTETTYDFKGSKYNFTNCVEVSILNFIIAMLANDTQTAIDLNLLGTIAEKENITIHSALKTFLTTHQNIAFMQTKQNQDAWNQVVQSLDGVVYVKPLEASAEDKFYEIKTALRNILSVFNHLFFGASSKFEALSVEERLNRLCSIFNRQGFTVTWNVAGQDVNKVDVNVLHYQNITTIPILVINFEIEKMQTATFGWNLESNHSYISSVVEGQRWSIEKTISLLLQSKLNETTLLSLFSWVAGSLPLQDVLNQININNFSPSYTTAILFMQNLLSNEQKLEIIKNILSIPQDPAMLAIIPKMIVTLPDDRIYNDEIYILVHNYNIEPLYNILNKNISDEKELLLKAIKNKYANFVKQAIKTRIEIINPPQHSFETIPLHFAVENNNKEMVAVLIEAGADVNRQDRTSKTALYIASEKGYEDIVQSLLVHGADSNIADNSGLAPLHRAASKCRKNVVELLINNGADVNVKNNILGRTPLYFALHNSYKDFTGCYKRIIELLIDHQATIEPMDLFAALSNKDIVQSLINKGINFNIKIYHGVTPLHRAATRSFVPDVVELLINNGADVNVQDDEGQTPLHRATESNAPNEKTVALLLDHGADITIKNKQGLTAQDIALKKGFTNIVKILQAKENELQKQ